MDHSYYKDKLSAFSDGALEAQERELIRRHLEGCLECQEMLKRLNSFGEAIEEKSGLAGDEYFERLAQKIEKRIATPVEKVTDIRYLHWKSFWWKVSATAASILLVAIVVNYQLKDDSDMPARLLQDSDRTEAPSLPKSDSISTRENFESGRYDGKNEVAESEIAGQAIDEEKGIKKKEVAAKPDLEEKDERQMAVSKELVGALESNVPATPPKESSEGSVAPAAGLTDKSQVGSRVPDDFAMADKMESSSQTIIVQQNTLSEWRNQRDSIQTVLGFELDTVQARANNQLKRLAEPKVSGYMQSVDSGKVYQQLANSWYQIGLQTSDSTEKNRAIQFLNWYKNRFPVDSPAVNQQLQQLPK